VLQAGYGLVAADSGLSLAALSGPMLFAANGATESGRWGTDGSFLVGTTSNAGWNSASIAEFRTSRQYGTSFYQNNNNGGYAAASFRVDYAGLLLAGFYHSTSQVGNITTNGSTTSYNTSSDARLKSGIANLTPDKALRALTAYQPQEYMIRGRPGVGALAQDVDRRMSVAGFDAVALGLVARGDGEAARREGQPGFQAWSMDNAKMVPFVVTTALDHDMRIRTLEAQNAALGRQLEEMTKRVASLERR
jgi:hypothetical protein